MNSWYFTFGPNQFYPGTNGSVNGSFVVIEAESQDAATDRMNEAFGRGWSHQYDSAEAAGVGRHNFRQIPFATPAIELRERLVAHGAEIRRAIANDDRVSAQASLKQAQALVSKESARDENYKALPRGPLSYEPPACEFVRRYEVLVEAFEELLPTVESEQQSLYWSRASAEITEATGPVG